MDQSVNRWAGRAQEDHSNDAFECEIDVATLPAPEEGRAVYDVTVRLELGSHTREAAFQSRRVIGSPGLVTAMEVHDSALAQIASDHLPLKATIDITAALRKMHGQEEFVLSEVSA